MKQTETANRKTHLTVKEVAARWSVSENYVRRLIWDNKLDHTKFGRSVRVPLEAVEEYALKKTVVRLQM